MEDANADDYFSDDGFDALPPSTLLALEQSAFQASQRQKIDNPSVTRPALHAPAPHASARAWDQSARHALLPQEKSRLRPVSPAETDVTVVDLDADVVDQSNAPILHSRTGLSTISSAGPVARKAHSNTAYGYNNAARYESYGSGRDPAQQPPYHAASVQGAAPGQRASHSREGLGQYDSDVTMTDTASEEWVGGNGPEVSLETENVKAQLQELARERERMLQDIKEARSNAEARAGEIAIIRANNAKLSKEHDRQVAALQQAMTDEIEKHKTELAASLAESKRIMTENAFLKQDLVEEASRIRKIQAELKAKSKVDEKGAPTTPRISRTLPLRDGFDDDEIAAFSPTKSSGGRSRKGTPSVPGKRKRKATLDSPLPLPSLQLSQSERVSAEEPPEDVASEVARQSLLSDDRDLRYMQKIWSHRTHPYEERDFEMMTKFSFPSEPGRLFSSLILEETSVPTSTSYPVHFAKVIISLWSRALEEEFYKPIDLFMSMINFILNLDANSFTPDLIEDLVPVLQRSGNVNGVVRFSHSPVSSMTQGQLKETPQEKLHHEVNATEALNTLHLMASGCLDSEDAMVEFWRAMRYNFVLLMLNVFQPISDIVITLNLLSTSIRQSSFGPLLNTEQEQIQNENYIIDRAANLLSEVPRVDEGVEPYTEAQICHLRLTALSFLTELAFSAHDPGSNHGGSMIAAHPVAMARLIRSMHDELDTLYSYTPDHRLHAMLVNGITRLVYGLIQNHGQNIDLRKKLLMVMGGTQKYLVVLTRLAFCERHVLDSGIDDDTIEMAHQMLEDAVNPQEAEALLEVFPSARRED